MNNYVGEVFLEGLTLCVLSIIFCVYDYNIKNESKFTNIVRHVYTMKFPDGSCKIHIIEEKE